MEGTRRRHLLSIGLLVILHIVGAVSLRIPALAELVLSLTPVNLLITAVVVLGNHDDRNRRFWLGVAIAFLFGFFLEVLGVKTGVIFGEYSYGGTLGPKLLDVPLMIGVNWLVLVYASTSITSKLKLGPWAGSLVGGLLMVGLDFFIEPVAVRLDFWSWEGGAIPLQNYLAWFIASFFLNRIFHYLEIPAANLVAIAAYFIQLFFFLSLWF